MPRGRSRNVKKNVQIQGRRIVFRNKPELKRKTGLDKDAAGDLINDKNLERILLDKRTGALKRFNIKSPPLALRQFGIRRISTKKLFSKDITIKRNIKLTDKLKGSDSVNVTLEITIRFNISRDHGQVRRITKNYIGKIKDMDEFVNDEVVEYLSPIIYDIINPEISYIIKSTFSGQTMSYDGVYMREVHYLFNDELKKINIPEGENCVRYALKQRYKRISPKTIDGFGDDNGVQVSDVLKFAQKYRIYCIGYDITGNVVVKHAPEVRSKTHKKLIFVVYNNHFYLVQNKYLNTGTSDLKRVNTIRDGREKLVEFLNRGVLPKNIKLRGQKITSFVVDNVKYVCNPDYTECSEILKTFGIEDKMRDSMNFNALGGEIEKLYLKESVASFWPYSSRFIKGGFNYRNYDIDLDERITTIDKNKDYSFCLKKLPYLLKTDFRQNKIYTEGVEFDRICKLIPAHYLYIAEPEESTLLMPNTDVYWGEHLKACRRYGIKFKIHEVMTCKKVYNYYSQMVTDIYNKVDPSIAKRIMNVHIGKFECDVAKYENYVFDRIGTEEEMRLCDGYKFNITKDYTINTKKSISVKLKCNKPISIQIKDMSRLLLFVKMLDMGIKQDDIVQIKTDSISYIGNYTCKLDDTIDGWKEEEFEPMNYDKEIQKNPVPSFKYKMEGSHNNLHLAYAGYGKTYFILNKILPKIEGKKDYIILTPSHASLIEYKNAGVNCEVIQKYSLSNTLPTEDFIIVDEIGMCDKKINDLLFKCDIAGKRIFSFGDFRQLLPVNDIHCNSKHYLDMFYRTQIRFTKNHRNDFTEAYYDQLISAYGELSEKRRAEVWIAKYEKKINELEKGNIGNLRKNKKWLTGKVILEATEWPNRSSREWWLGVLKEQKAVIAKKLQIEKEIEKHSTKTPEDAEVIICWYNNTVDAYNEYMLKKLKRTKYDVGTKLICRSNDLRDKDIYNNFVLDITERKDDIFKLSNGAEITKKQLDKYFKPAYARTVYGIQGQSLRSFYFPKEDYKCLSGRRAYTIISRLKTK